MANNGNNTRREISTTLQLRDVVVILTVAISVASTFFMYDRRLAVLEDARLRDEQTISANSAQIRQNSQDIQSQRFSDRQEIESEISDLKTDVALAKTDAEVAMDIKHRQQQEQKKNR